MQDCGHEEELQFLRQRNEALENENVALMAETRELQARVGALVTDLSIKEAKWCETEEELKMKASEVRRRACVVTKPANAYAFMQQDLTSRDCVCC